MDDDYGQRRRVAVALAITVILVPAAFLLNRGGDETDDASTGSLVGQVLIPGETTAPAASAEGGEPADDDPMGTTPPEVLDGTVPDRADEPPTIAIPRPAQAIRGDASFSRGISDIAACQVRDLASIPFGSEITVTNLDNSRSVRCVASVGGPSADADVILNADAFLQIGDLTDAPLSVELSW